MRRPSTFPPETELKLFHYIFAADVVASTARGSHGDK